MIQARKLTKWYGPILALDAIDLDVTRGRIVGFLGPNGAGKTTCIRIMTCFMPPTAGSATINGYDVFKQADKVRASIGYLPENTPLYTEMRVIEHLHYFGKLHGIDRSTRRRRIEELTDRCALTAILHRPVGQLSKGNRQRVGLAQALLHDPPVLILDEPTVGLDPGQITSVRKLIGELAGHKTVLISTHILPEVERTCQDVVIINRGRIVAAGTPDELKAKVRRGSRVLMEVGADPAVVKPTLEQVAGVTGVTTTARGGWCVAAITPRAEAGDIREALARTAAAQHWIVREMRYEMASLEEFFVQITAQENVAAA